MQEQVVLQCSDIMIYHDAACCIDAALFPAHQAAGQTDTRMEVAAVGIVYVHNRLLCMQLNRWRKVAHVLQGLHPPPTARDPAGTCTGPGTQGA